MRTTSQGHTVQRHKGSKVTPGSRPTNQEAHHLHHVEPKEASKSLHRLLLPTRGSVGTISCIALTASQRHHSHNRVTLWLQLTGSSNSDRHWRVRERGYTGRTATSHTGDWQSGCQVGTTRTKDTSGRFPLSQSQNLKRALVLPDRSHGVIMVIKIN